MSTIVGSATVPANATVAAFILPPGYANITLYQYQLTAQAIYLGTSPHVSATIGMIVPNTPLNQETYSASTGPTTVYATTGNATASSFSYIISTTTN